MVTVRVCLILKTRRKSVVFINKVGKNSRYFVGVFKKIIPLALVGYKVIIANSAHINDTTKNEKFIALYFKNI